MTPFKLHATPKPGQTWSLKNNENKLSPLLIIERCPIHDAWIVVDCHGQMQRLWDDHLHWYQHVQRGASFDSPSKRQRLVEMARW